MILHKHGLFSFGEDARESYERTIALVTRAEDRLKVNRRAVFATAQMPQQIAPASDVAPIVRGACALQHDKIEGSWRRLILEFRASDAVVSFVNGAELNRYGKAGVVTPDHVIRTKGWPLIVPAPEAGNLDDFHARRGKRRWTTSHSYKQYFARQNKRIGGGKKMVDPLPRIVLVPGLGLFGLLPLRQGCAHRRRSRRGRGCHHHRRRSHRAFPVDHRSRHVRHRILADRASQARQGERQAAGRPDCRHHRRRRRDWRRDRKGVRRGRRRGGAARNPDYEAAETQAAAIGAHTLPVMCDVTNENTVGPAFQQVVETFGGVDILVSNAGAAWQGRIGEVDEAMLRKSFELNFYGHQRVAQAAVKIMLAQGTGGCLLFNVSKQAVNPVPNRGPTALPKAATLFLRRGNTRSTTAPTASAPTR